MHEKILLVEDDIELAQLTQEYLASFDYQVSVETNGAAAVERIQQEQPDLVLLDVMLPDMDGIAVCCAVRASYTGPIIMLTARTEQIDQLLGLEVGADDYLCKPVEPRILAARVKAHLRREERTEPPLAEKVLNNTISAGDLSIYSLQRRVELAGQEVDLSTPEYDLLWLLASRAGEILSRDELFSKLRGIEYDGQNRAVDIHISHLRTKIGDDSARPKRIKTVRGKGYIFIPDS